MIYKLITFGFFVVFAFLLWQLLSIAKERDVQQSTNFEDTADLACIEARMCNQNSGTPGAKVVDSLKDAGIHYCGVEENNDQRI